ncbi:radical SAM peptide maturase [Bacteroides hominis]|uniref:radical SAM peptide maturase n=1 Tax=Bacteroides hominis TaxID=2763023 RepID=UPI003D6A391A
MVDFFKIAAEDIEYEVLNLKQITLEVTSLCNLKCSYCCYGELYRPEKRKESFLSFQKVKKIFDFLFEFWSHYQIGRIKTYVSFYGGEPLLAMELIKEIIDYIEKNKKNDRLFVYSMTTNGVLLDRYIDFLVDNSIEILVSLDGDQKCNSYRINNDGHNSYHAVYRNLKMIKKEYPFFFEKYISFNSVLHNRNSVLKINRFFKKQFDKVSNISELSEVGIKSEKILLYDKMHVNYGDSMLKDDVSSEEAKEMGLKKPELDVLSEYFRVYSGNMYEDYNDLLTDDSKRRRMQTGTCIPFSKKMFLTTDGDILPCERISLKYAYGKVTEERIDLDYENIAIVFNGYLSKIKHLCSKCYAAKHCLQCMYQLDLIEKRYCSSFLTKEGFANYEKRNLQYLYNSIDDNLKIVYLLKLNK